ncbi:MAG: acylase [Chloroflexi bacterium]|nr:acylase [Chloroflexota bacterium]MCI0578691.1 acylase [Chloroflexota bacterium]MCI0648351.1 acylase [Chloroflexota bacterium]MCI0729679.1 acylase [Chloroflexota bacterium]
MWKRILITILVLLAAAGLYIFWPERDELSYLASAGDNYDARILRDTWGVPHVFGVSDADAAYGLAYAHAEDDFLTIQQTILAARGRLATVYGRDAAPNDYMVQLLRIWDVVEANYETGIAEDTRAMLDGYAAGLNHYAALHEDEALPGLFPISGKDMVAASVHKSPLFFGLDGTLAELFSDEPLAEEGETRRPGDQETDLHNYTTTQLHNHIFGSNTFAVSPARSANGETFLAVNSHQPWSGPLSWYEAHVHSEEGWDAAGALLPGVPTIVHGHNRDVGWAFTVNDSDLIDVYILEINPDNPNQYRFDGQWRELEVREAPITVKIVGRLRWTVKEEVLWSVYGPVARRPHGVYAIRYAGFGEVGIFEQLYRLNKARNFEEWQTAMRLGQLPTFNAGYADREGNIYYLYNGLLPVRAEGYDWQAYLPGDSSETLWTEYLPFDQLPQVFNPAAGFIQNTNNSPFRTTLDPGNPDPAAYSPTLGIDQDMNNRALRALELFGGDDSITEEEFYTYKYDMAYAAESNMALFLQELLSAPIPDDPDLQAGLALLESWDLRANPENPAAALAILTAQPFDGDPNTPPAEIVDSYTQTVRWLLEHHGRLDVPWQEVNRLERGDLDVGLGGGPDVLHAIYGNLADDGYLHGHAGDSYIMLVTWDANGQVHSRSIHQFGSATARPDSPHYADQVPLFAQRQLKPVWLDEADIRANLEREYRPGEEVD